MERATDIGGYVAPPSAPLSPAERLANALKDAIYWFRDYEKQHAAKGTPDGYRKAATNAERAEELEEALNASGVTPRV